MVSKKQSEKPKSHTRKESKIKQAPQTTSDLDSHQTSQDTDWDTSDQPLLEPICAINLRVPEQTELVNVHSIKQRFCKGKSLLLESAAEFEPTSRKRETRKESLRRQILKYSERQALARTNESLSKCEKRLAVERVRRALDRANETSEKRERRLACQRERCARDRANETFEKHERRLAAQRQRRALARANETSSERERRLAVQRERCALARAKEASSKRQRRLAYARERSALARAKESSPERQKRLAIERERRALSRAQETSAQRRKRLAVERERRARARANETSSKCHKSSNTKKKRGQCSPESEEELDNKIEHGDVANANEMITETEPDEQLSNNPECFDLSYVIVQIIGESDEDLGIVRVKV